MKPEDLKVGDVIDYGGYLKEGKIHALWIEKRG